MHANGWDGLLYLFCIDFCSSSKWHCKHVSRITFEPSEWIQIWFYDCHLLENNVVNQDILLASCNTEKRILPENVILGFIWIQKQCQRFTYSHIEEMSYLNHADGRISHYNLYMDQVYTWKNCLILLLLTFWRHFASYCILNIGWLFFRFEGFSANICSHAFLSCTCHMQICHTI